MGSPVLSVLPPQQQWATRLSDAITQNPVVSGIKNGVSGLQNAMGNAGDNFVNWYANSVPNNPPANKAMLGNLMRVGSAAAGMPIPTNQGGPATGDALHPLQSVVAPEDENAKAVASLQGIKIPKGQQKDSVIANNIETAAKGNKTMLMTYQAPDRDEEKVYRLEPMSYRGDNSEQLYAFDRTDPSRIKRFNVDNIINVTPTNKSFSPRIDPKSGKPFAVEIGASPENTLGASSVNVKGAATSANPKGSATLQTGNSTANLAGNVKPSWKDSVEGAVPLNSVSASDLVDNPAGIILPNNKVLLGDKDTSHQDLFRQSDESGAGGTKIAAARLKTATAEGGVAFRTYSDGSLGITSSNDTVDSLNKALSLVNKTAATNIVFDHFKTDSSRAPIISMEGTPQEVTKAINQRIQKISK